MIDFLIVRLRSVDDLVAEPLSWVTVSLGGGVLDSGNASLGEIGEFHASLETRPKIVVLVPASDVLLTTVEVPAGQHRYAKQALPFLVEEQLIDDVEDVHLAMGPVVRGQLVPVAVVKHDVIIHWLDALYGAGLQPNILISEALALPWADETISVLLQSEHCLIRDGRWHGLGCDSPNVSLILSTLLRPGVDRSFSINVYHGDGELLEAAARKLEQELIQDPRVQVQRYCLDNPEREVLELATVKEFPRSLNLMQGGYKVDSPGISGTLNLRRVGLTLAACVALQLFALLSVGLWFSWQADKIQLESAALYRSWFPEVRRIINPRRQLESQLARQGASGSEQLLAYLSDVLSVWNMDSERLRLRSLDYEGETRRLSLEVEAGDEEQLRQLRLGLDSLGVESELRRVAREGDRVAGHLELLGT